MHITMSSFACMHACVCVRLSVISCGGVAAARWAPSGTGTDRDDDRERERETQTTTMKIDRIFSLNVISLQILCGGQALKYGYFA